VTGGIKRARIIYGLCKGTGEPKQKCKAKRARIPYGKAQK